MVEVKGKIERVRKRYYYFKPWWRLDVAVDVVGLKPVVGRIMVDWPLMKKLLKQDPTSERIEDLTRHAQERKAFERSFKEQMKDPEKKKIIEPQLKMLQQELRQIGAELRRLNHLRKTGESIIGMNFVMRMTPTREMRSIVTSKENIKKAI